MSTQVDLFTNVEPTSVSPAIAKPFVSRSTFYQGDCLVEMDKIADKSVDMILCDLPYGTTACKWDIVIPFEPLWKHYDRIIKDNGAIVLFGDEPFSSHLRLSKLIWYKYDLVWVKNKPANINQSKTRHLKYHETISLFCNGKIGTYNKQMIDRSENGKKVYKSGQKNNTEIKSTFGDLNGNKNAKIYSFNNYDAMLKNPSTCLYYNKVKHTLHPTQKPEQLIENLILTFTNEGETVVDNCMGSGTTGVACKKTGRHFIGIEKDEKYFEIAVSRVSAYCG